jgi:hypothetical protein
MNQRLLLAMTSKASNAVELITSWIARAHASEHGQIKIGKICANFDKQSSSELNGSLLSSAER